MNEADRNRLALLLLNDGGGSLSRRSAVSNAFTSAVAPDPTQAEFLRSEKDTRPFYETEHRASVLPLVMSGYNNSVGYGAPVIAGGRMWDVLGDITSGRPTTMDELRHAAEQGAGAALLSSPFVKAPAGALRSGAMRSQPPAPSRSLDPLGYYSKALEEAQNLPSQASPDQILATLRNKGVKPGEIEATGLAEALMGKPSVSRDDVVRHLTENRVGLNEVVRGRGGDPAFEIAAMVNDEIRTGAIQPGETRGSYSYGGMEYPTYEAAESALRNRLRREAPTSDNTKWSEYSLDPSNPTYRETVLHLPLQRRMSFDQFLQSYRERFPKSDLPDAEVRSFYDKGIEIPGIGKTVTQKPDVAFQSGHFDEPNIVGHLMTSVNKHEGKPVYTIDQIQSDWGQRIETDTRNALAERLFGKRFKELTADERKQVSAAKQEGDKPAGVRDEAKIAELKSRIELMRSDLRAALDEAITLMPNKADVFNKIFDNPAVNAGAWSILNGKADSIYKKISAHQFELPRLMAELRTAEAATPGNPLVNTTDQWTNTVLRRAIQQAIDSDAEKIAVPRGDTVLSYNSGDDHGMNAFYNDIVPKNLAKILAGLDRQGVAQKYVSQLATPSGMRGNGFTVFDLTPAMRDAARKGMPLFAAPHAGLLPLLMQQKEQGQ